MSWVRQAMDNDFKTIYNTTTDHRLRMKDYMTTDYVHLRSLYNTMAAAISLSMYIYLGQNNFKIINVM